MSAYFNIKINCSKCYKKGESILDLLDMGLAGFEPRPDRNLKVPKRANVFVMSTLAFFVFQCIYVRIYSKT